MVEILTKHKRELETELRERVQAFFEANNESPESVSIAMKLSGSGEERNLSAIHILIKDTCTDTTLINTPI